MKFNKSTESDFWYVGDNFGRHYGCIKMARYRKRYVFSPNISIDELQDSQLDEISSKIKELNRESGIDTTSTFKSNSQ